MENKKKVIEKTATKKKTYFCALHYLRAIFSIKKEIVIKIVFKDCLKMKII